MIGALIGMKQMNDNYFVDTNVLIYALGNDILKKDIAIGLISVQAMISTQIISEMANVMFRKLKLDYPDIRKAVHYNMTLPKK
jgi:predicted nucleic acid-binding protein